MLHPNIFVLEGYVSELAGFLFPFVYQYDTYQGCRKRGGWGGALAEQLTLSQPGRQIMPTTVLRAPPPDF